MFVLDFKPLLKLHTLTYDKKLSWMLAENNYKTIF